MKVLLLVPHTVSPERRAAIEEGRHPVPDYEALARRIRSLPRNNADILDRDAVDSARQWLVRLVLKIAGYDWALALLGLLRCKEYDVVFTHAENVGKPFALFLSFLSRRPAHVTIGNYLVGRRNKLWYRLFAVDRQMDRIFAASRSSYLTALEYLRVPSSKVTLLETYGCVDIDFFSADVDEIPHDNLVCAVGREFRDYRTLLAAMKLLPHLALKVEANSPWSVHASEIERLEIPPNVETCHMQLGTVRRLYAEASIVAIPLLDNPIGAGLTSLIEALAMGKAVVITASPDATYAGHKGIVDGCNALLVPCGDIEAWRNALARLTADPALRARLGRNGRAWVQRYASREKWLDIILSALRDNYVTQTRPTLLKGFGPPGKRSTSPSNSGRSVDTVDP